MILNIVISMNKEERKQDEIDNNMEYYCEHHSDERLKEWQEHNKDVKVEAGDHIKVSFPAAHPEDPGGELTKEWMWVEITSIQKSKTGEDRILGRLDNEPVYITNPKVRYRDIIITFRDEISDLIKGNRNV